MTTKTYAIDGTRALLFADTEDQPWNGWKTPVVTRDALDHYLSQTLASHGHERWAELKRALDETYAFNGFIAHGNGLMWEEVDTPEGFNKATSPTLIAAILRSRLAPALAPVNYADTIARVIAEAPKIAEEAGLCGGFEEAVLKMFGEAGGMHRAIPRWDVSVTLANNLDTNDLIVSKKFGFGGNRDHATVQDPDGMLRLRCDVEFSTEYPTQPDREYIDNWLEANGFKYDDITDWSVERNDDDC